MLRHTENKREHNINIQRQRSNEFKSCGNPIVDVVHSSLLCAVAAGKRKVAPTAVVKQVFFFFFASYRR